MATSRPDAQARGVAEVQPPDRAAAWEPWFNAAFALSALAAAVMRLVSASGAERWTPAVIGVAAINAQIAVLFLIRRPVVAIGTPAQLISCLPTMVGFGLALKFSPPLSQWPWPAHVLFAGGAALTMAAFVALGSSFGVLPALRKIVERGPYRLVRHPAYAGELVMAAACFSAGPALGATTAWALLLPGVVWRILSEERVLSRDPSYAEYTQRVRWRLVPGVW